MPDIRNVCDELRFDVAPSAWPMAYVVTTADAVFNGFATATAFTPDEADELCEFAATFSRWRPIVTRVRVNPSYA